jgi:hypothetical protein
VSDNSKKRLAAEDRVDFGPVFDAELDTLFNNHVITARNGLARLITAASGGYVVVPVVAHRGRLRRRSGPAPPVVTLGLAGLGFAGAGAMGGVRVHQVAGGGWRRRRSIRPCCAFYATDLTSCNRG